MAPATIGGESFEHAGKLIFEAPEAYLANNNRPGYWGPPTSTIDWCERNYVVSYYVAEWWNTLSNIGLFVLGLWGIYWGHRQRLESRFTCTFVGVMLVGVGSAAFHGTLTHVGQQGDETPMMIAMACWLHDLFCLSPAFEKSRPAAARAARWGTALFIVAWSIVHWYCQFVLFFQSLFGVMAISGVVMMVKEYRRCKEPGARRLVQLYICTWFVALPVWIIDQQLCTKLYDLPAGLPNPQLHAHWHLLMGVNAYVGPVFVVFQRQAARGLAPRIRYSWGFPWIESEHLA